MVYDADQCEMCGGIRANGSTLCVNCLVRQLTAEKEALKERRERTKGLKKKIELLKGMLDDALNYGLKKNQENGRLLARCRELEELITGRL